MVGSGRISTDLLRYVILLGFLCLLCFGLLSNQPRRLALSSVASSKSFELLGKQRIAVHHASHIHFVSKRRVPNGPDPIHNRYVTHDAF